MKKQNLLSVLVVVLSVLPAFGDPATGWKQTAAGTYDYNNTDNWVNGEVNGIFGSDLTLAGAQTITFAADTTLSDGLSFAYKGNFGITLQSDGTGAKTLLLGGDITCAVSANGTAAHVTIGSDTSTDNLAIDLGGETRTITATATQNDPSKIGWVKLYAPMSNGAVTYAGLGCIKLYAANAYTGGTTLSNTGYIYLNDSACFGSGAVTVADCGGSVWPRLHCDVAAVTIANDFTLLGDFGFHGGKQTTLTGTITIPAPIRFWCESDNLVLNGPAILDGNGGCGVGNLRKWGSKTVNVYTPITVGGTTITVANGIWNQRGAISGGAFSLVGDTGGNAYFHCYSADNSFTGPVTVHGDPNFLYLSFQTSGALPDGVTILLTDRGLLLGVPAAGYSCGSLLANGRVDPASTGGIAFVTGDNTDIDLTNYPSLTVASSGNSTFNGKITASNGLYHFRSPSHIYLGAANALTGKADVLVDFPSSSTSLYLDNRNEVEGTVIVRNGGLILRTDAGSLPNADIHVYGGTFYIDSNKNTGTRRAEYVHLHGGALTYAGNKNYATSDSIGELVVDVRDPSLGVLGGVVHMTFNANGKTAQFHVDTLTRTNNAIWRMGGNADNNRLRIGGENGANTVQFTVGNAAAIQSELVGGGGAPGTTTISVYPFGFANVSTYYDSLLTYGDTGFRALDYETEYATSITPGTVSQDNVRLPVGSTTDITSDTTVNSVFMQGSDPNKGSTYINGSGTLTVTSGVLVMGYHRNAKPVVQCAAVNFGTHPGVICFARGKGSDWKAGLKGSAGAIFFQTANLATTDSGGTGVTISGSNAEASTLTGDVVIHGYLVCSANGALPGGANRPGKLYVNGYGNLLDGNGFNGLFGIGCLYRAKDTIVVGADGSDGNFEGYLSNTTTLVKNGAGRQRIGGACTHSYATTVNAGVLQVDGSFSASAVTVASGATLGGVGSFDKAVTVADGALLEAGSAQIAYADDHALDFGNTLALSGNATLRVHVYDKQSLATVNAAAISGSGTVTVAMDSGNYNGTFLVLKSDAAIPCTFSKGANCGGLSLRNGGTELWVSYEPAIIILLR